MKKSNYLLILFLFSSLFNFGQQLGEYNPTATFENDAFANFQKKTPMMQELFQKIRNSQEEIKYDIGSTIGSPFENKEYQKGKVYYENEFLGDYYYRFNAYNQEIELKKTLLPEEKMQALIQNPKVKLVTDKNSYQFARIFNDNGNAEDAYLKLFYEGDIYNLYERYIVKFKEGKPAANSMVTPIASRFTNYIEYYYKEKGSNSIKEIPQKQSKFLKLFEKSNVAEIKNYIKSNNLDVTAKNDLINLYSFIEN